VIAHPVARRGEVNLYAVLRLEIGINIAGTEFSGCGSAGLQPRRRSRNGWRMLQTDKYAVNSQCGEHVDRADDEQNANCRYRRLLLSAGALCDPPRGMAGAVRLVATAVSVIVASWPWTSMTRYISPGI